MLGRRELPIPIFEELIAGLNADTGLCYFHISDVMWKTFYTFYTASVLVSRLSIILYICVCETPGTIHLIVVVFQEEFTRIL